MIAALLPLALFLGLGPDDPPAEPAAKPGVIAPAIPGDELNDVVGPLVPLHPRTAEEQGDLETLDEYVGARALEGPDQRRPRESIELLEKALKRDPESTAILHRLCRLSFGLGRIPEGVDYGRRVLKVHPDDAAVLALLLEHYQLRRDLAGAETLLSGVLADPKLDKGSATALLARKALGDLYAGHRPPQVAKAAEAYAQVVEGLDARAAGKFSPADHKRILGDEAQSYERFGDVFFVARRFDLAALAYRRGLAYEPDNDDLPRKLAQAQFRASKPAEALETLEASLKDSKPEGAEAYELLAQILTALKRAEEAIPRLEQAVKDDPKNVPLQSILADRLTRAGQVEKARAIYAAILKAQPDQGLAAQAEVLRRQHKNADLLKLLEQALAPAQAPDRQFAVQQAILPLVKSIALDPPYAEELLDEGIRMLEAEPPTLGIQGRLALGSIATEAKRTDKLVAIARAAVKQDPTADAALGLFEALDQDGKFAEAADTLEAFHEKFPDRRSAETLRALAVDRIRAGQAEKGVAVLEEMLEKFPELRGREGSLLLGQALLQAGRLDDALKVTREVLEVDRDNSRALNLVGVLLGRLNRNDEAIAHYKGLLDRYSNDDDMVKTAHIGLSNIYVNQDELDKGEAELEALLIKDPNDAGVNNDLGYLYADRGKDLEKAEAMVRKAVEEDPDNAAYLDSLAWVLFKRGKAREALEPLEKAVKTNFTDATIYDHMGDIYFRLQEPSKAKAAWEKAEALAGKSSPPDKRLPEIRKKLDELNKSTRAPKAATGENP